MKTNWKKVTTLLFIIITLSVPSISQASIFSASATADLSEYNLDNIEAIDIKSGSDDFKIATGKNLTPTITVYYVSDKKNAVSRMTERLSLVERGNRLKIDTLASRGPISFTMCAISKFNNMVVSVQGTCVNYVELVLPDDFGPTVNLNSQLVWGEQAYDYDNFFHRFEECRFNDDKMEALKDYVQNTDETTLSDRQVIRVLEEFSFPSDQIEALKLLKNHFTIEGDIKKIANVFDFDSYKTEAYEILLSD